MRTVLTLICCSYLFVIHAQESPFGKVGKLKPEHFQTTSYLSHNNADAIVLYDKGHTSIEGNDKGWFSAVFKRRKLTQIKKKDGYKYADVEINLFSKNGVEERLLALKAVTHNLDNGKVGATAIGNNEIFRTRQDENRLAVRFVMPQVREGSIIEFEYTIKTDFYWQIEPWHFQSEIPTVWSEYVFSVPQFFTYTSLSKGYQPFLINTKKESQGYFRIANINSARATVWKSFSSGVTDFRWVRKDIPPIEEESFTSSIQNHISGIEFTLASQNAPLEPRDFRMSWTDVTEELLGSEKFGKNLNSANGWLEDETQQIVNGASSEQEKAKRIFSFLRDNFQCTDHTSIYTELPLSSVFKNRRGNVAEINLLLTAMLRIVQINAGPVILSRAEYGYVYETYPSLARFNYVITKADIGGTAQFLDASQQVGFGQLLAECYNGFAILVNDSADSIYLKPDSLLEKKETIISLNTEGEGKLVGMVRQVVGKNESYDIRSLVKGKGIAALFKQISETIGAGLELSEGKVDSIEAHESPVSVKYKLEVVLPKDDLISLNPMFVEGYRRNSFEAKERLYPVEIAYALDESFTLVMEIPAGYEVNKMPKPIRLKYDESGKNFFQYNIQRSGNQLTLRSQLKLSKTYFEPEEYSALKSFFDIITEKHNEHIVLKKKKE